MCKSQEPRQGLAESSSAGTLAGLQSPRSLELRSPLRAWLRKEALPSPLSICFQDPVLHRLLDWELQFLSGCWMVGLSREQLLTWQLVSSEQVGEESWRERMMEGTTCCKAVSEAPSHHPCHFCPWSKCQQPAWPPGRGPHGAWTPGCEDESRHQGRAPAHTRLSARRRWDDAQAESRARPRRAGGIPLQEWPTWGSLGEQSRGSSPAHGEHVALSGVLASIVATLRVNVPLLRNTLVKHGGNLPCWPWLHLVLILPGNTFLLDIEGCKQCAQIRLLAQNVATFLQIQDSGPSCCLLGGQLAFFSEHSSSDSSKSQRSMGSIPVSLTSSEGKGRKGGWDWDSLLGSTTVGSKRAFFSWTEQTTLGQ